MKSNNISKWNYNKDLEGLLLFASLVDEITFNYSIDAHKAPALNAVSLLQDVYETIENVERGIIREAGIPSLLGELVTAINGDRLFKQILERRNLLYFITLLEQANNLKDIKLLIEMMVSGGIGDEYFENVKSVLIDLIVNNAKDKESIGYYSRIWVTHLKYLGYSSEYIYFSNREFFFGKNIIEAPNAIVEFLDKFSEVSKDYYVLFRGNKIFQLLKSTFRKFGDDVTEEYKLPYKNASIDKFIRNLSVDNNLIVLNVHARDQYSARAIAISKIESISSLFCCYQHKQRTQFKEKCIIIEKESRNVYTIDKPMSAILRCRDLRPNKSQAYFTHITKKLSMSQDSIINIMKSLRMHESAVDAMSHENQFINLFTALEIIIPKDIKSGKSRIQQIYDTLVPFLCLDYCRKHIRSFIADLLRLYNPEFVAVISKVTEGKRLEEKVCALLTLKKYDAERQELYDVFTKHNEILLRNRFYRLDELMSNPANLLERLKKHKQRLQQQIDRIYRTRNLIVHAGDTPFYIDTLIENLHFYYDTLVKQLLYDNTENGHERLEHIYLSFYIKEQNFEAKLQDIACNEAAEGMFDESNYDIIVNTI